MGLGDKLRNRIKSALSDPGKKLLQHIAIPAFKGAFSTEETPLLDRAMYLANGVIGIAVGTPFYLMNVPERVKDVSKGIGKVGKAIAGLFKRSPRRTGRKAPIQEVYDEPVFDHNPAVSKPMPNQSQLPKEPCGRPQTAPKRRGSFASRVTKKSEQEAIQETRID